MNRELQFLIYNTPTENVKIDVVVKDETIWLTQKAMAALFGVQIPAINKHLTNIYEDGELEKDPTVSILEIVQQEGNRNITRQIEFY
ncbi:MAG: cell filamentation protein Fic, partial [Tannerella sp.]|nr:cell filamentation protein Fic [Tannerella sp.]